MPVPKRPSNGGPVQPIAFAVYKDSRDANIAVRKLNNTFIRGSRIFVSYARGRNNRNKGRSRSRSPVRRGYQRYEAPRQHDRYDGRGGRYVSPRRMPRKYDDHRDNNRLRRTEPQRSANRNNCVMIKEKALECRKSRSRSPVQTQQQTRRSNRLDSPKESVRIRSVSSSRCYSFRSRSRDSERSSSETGSLVSESYFFLLTFDWYTGGACLLWQVGK